MNAPLSEVPAVPKRDFAKAPPLFLSVVCALKVIGFIMGCVLHTPSAKISPFVDWAIVGLYTTLILALMFFLWRGYGLARGIWMWLAALTAPLYFLHSRKIHFSDAQQVLLFADLFLSVILFVYLNLPGVKAHFARRGAVE